MPRASIGLAVLLLALGPFLPLTGAVAQDSQVPVLLSLPDLNAAPGATLRVPLEISDVTGLNISSADLLVTYDARIVTANGVYISGTLTNRWAEAHRTGFVEGSQDTTGLIDIAVATSNRIPTGSGIFLYIEFTVSDSAQDGQATPLVLAEAILNNRTPQTTTRDGSVTVASSTQLIGDFNGDCAVDFKDFILFVTHFGLSQGDPRWDPIYDLTGDGKVDFKDFIVFIQHFGDHC